MRLAPGSRIHPYVIVAPLGAGGMGEVYRAHDDRLGRDVALKVIPAELARDPERIRRFEQEARAAGALSHPNVCMIHDIGVHEGSPFVVMELLEGRTLRETLASGALPVRMAVDYVAQAAQGLAAAHARGIVHRDLKPENLFVTKDERVKILDFGIAKLMRGEAAAAPGGKTESVTPTETGTVLGTAGYMAPEQAKGEPADERSDLFALGSILYELVTGKRAFRGASHVETLHAIAVEEPPPLSAVRPEAPAQLARILRHCLAKDPERRIQTAKDVRNQLEDLLHELEVGVAQESLGAATRPQPVLRELPLTAAHVRQLSNRNPRLIGYPMVALDNRVESDTLVVLLHGVGGDHRRFEAAVRTAPFRAVAPSLVGFEPERTNRPVVSMDDHSRLLRILLADLVLECRPRTVILVGFSAGADQFLRMIDSEEGAGVDVAGLVALGPNVSLETCFVSKLYANLDPDDPDGMLDVLKALAPARSLPIWPVLHFYISQTFSKLGAELTPLQQYAAEVVAPFEQPGDPLAGWFRAARARIPHVRFVFSRGEAAAAEALLARHLEHDVLGDDFAESSFTIEPIHHSELPEAGRVLRHVQGILDEIRGGAKGLRDA